MVLRSDGSPPRPSARSGAEAGAPASAAAGAVSFAWLAEIAVGTTTRVDLCRILDGPRKGQLCAVKRLHAHIAEDPSIATQFVDEVWMTAALRHPNVVEVAGWGEDPQGTYLAVELVQGVSLARLMKTVFETGEIFSERMVVFIASRLCRGLAAAHALRGPDGELLHLVHRDLTPGNVLASFEGQIKIADFGLAKAKQRLTKTITGLLKGQPGYMSPEHARGRDVDARSDLFSLGVMLFELFAGRKPWAPPSEIDVVQTMLTEPPADLRELRPKIDRELVAIVGKCLEREPAARFQSASEVQQRLEAWLGVHGYTDGNEEALARFVRRNAMRQMRWFERAVAGELAPGTAGSAPPPPPPTHTSSSNQPLARAPLFPGPDTRAPRARRRAGPEGTEITDVDPPDDGETRTVTKPPSGRPPAVIDWGEELPTLVQSQSAQHAKGAASPTGASGLPRVHIADEDSDGRTTAVKRPSAVAASMLGHGLPRIVHPITDADSEEMPTLPIDARLRDLLPHARAARPEPAPASQPQPSPRPPLVEPPSEETRPREERSPSPQPRELSVELLHGEVERLAREAKRLAEEAHEAAASAARAEAVSRMAAEAAVIASDALRLASSVGLASAGQRLDQALALEEAARRGDLRIVQIAPVAPRAAAPRPPVDPTPPPAPAVPLGPPPAPPPPAYPSSTPPPPGSFDPRASWPVATSQQGAIPPSAYETVPRRALPEAPGADRAKFATQDALAFQARLKPMLWGMPLPLALAFAAGIAALGLLVLWLLVT